VRLAIISDLHANREALKAILADIESLGDIDQIISAGNAVGLGPHPNEVLDLLREKQVESVMGNYEDAIAFNRMSSGVDFADEAAERIDRAAVVWTRRELNPANFKHLENLPQNVRLIGTSRHMTLKRDQPDERIAEARRGMFFGTILQPRARGPRVPTRRILVIHGSPRALNEAIREDTATSILERLAESARADVVISAHGGRPFLREVDRVTFVGTGVASGLRAMPEVAEYVVVTIEDDVTLEPRKVTYDRGPHVQAILDFGLPPALAARFDPTNF
jgi:predicted phosphodiesterase